MRAAGGNRMWMMRRYPELAEGIGQMGADKCGNTSCLWLAASPRQFVKIRAIRGRFLSFAAPIPRPTRRRTLGGAVLLGDGGCVGRLEGWKVGTFYPANVSTQFVAAVVV